MNYDLIGDIHGCAQSLAALLGELGYRQIDGVFRHAFRKVVFLGDFIDRGPLQREVVRIARSMVEAGQALAVMGNHEFNAIAYFTPSTGPGKHLRPHSEKNRGQHREFLAAYEDDPEAYADVIEWFRSLPLWLDLDGVRIVHACWDQEWIERIRREYGGGFPTDELLQRSALPGNWEFEAVETLLKGKEIPLPQGHSFRDKDGNERRHIRVRWWDSAANTHRAAFMGPESARTHIPDDPIANDHLIQYAHHAPPVFLGHYWMEGEPRPLATNIACLDFSVAKPGGKLVAYRWDGEKTLDRRKFVSVRRVEPG